MNFVRYVGYAVLFCALLLLGYEVVRYQETKSILLITVEQAWRAYSSAGLDVVYKSINDGYFSDFLGDFFEFVIGLPLLSVMVLAGAFLLFITRHSDAVL